MRNQVTTIYRQADRFAEITKRAIISGNILRAKLFLGIAENLYQNGTNETKSVISNIYVYSVSTFMELRNCSIANLFPVSLRKEYLKQINTFGI